MFIKIICYHGTDAIKRSPGDEEVYDIFLQSISRFGYFSEALYVKCDQMFESGLFESTTSSKYNPDTDGGGQTVSIGDFKGHVLSTLGI